MFFDYTAYKPIDTSISRTDVVSMSNRRTETHSRHDLNFVVTGGTGGRRDDNLRCRQIRQSCHHDNYVSH